jgi:hypothetical protein
LVYIIIIGSTITDLFYLMPRRGNMSLCNYDKDLLCKREDDYEISRKETFLRFYKNLQIKLLLDIDNLSELYDNGDLDEVYNINKSITQSLRAKTGKKFEKLVADLFTKLGVSFQEQVLITSDGIVSPSDSKSVGHRVDFVIPKPTPNSSVENYIIISCKTTLRERFRQDTTYPRLVVITVDSNIPRDDQGINFIIVSEKEKNLTKWVNNTLMKAELKTKQIDCIPSGDGCQYVFKKGQHEGKTCGAKTTCGLCSRHSPK